jgi:hypothetical protein
MSRRALGQHWKDRSPQEQAEFIPLFVNLLERSYLTAVGSYPLSTITFRARACRARMPRCGPASSAIDARFPSNTDSCRAAGDGPSMTSWRTA